MPPVRPKACLAALALLWLCPVLQAAAPPYRLTGQVAPDFALRASAGPNLRLSEYQGDVVLLAFWGSRCGVCPAQIAALGRLQQTYGSAGLRTIGVGIDDDAVASAKFAAAQSAAFPLLLDPAKEVSRAFRIDSLPMLLMIDRTGVIREVFRDFRSGGEAQYLAPLKTLLDE